MFWNDSDRYQQEWEDSIEISSSIPLDDYIHAREIEDYGPCDDELGTDDNEDY